MRLLFTIPIGLAFAISSATAQENTAPAGVPTSQITPPTAPTVSPVPAIKTDSDETEVTLDELVRRALENSPRLQIARENLEAAKGRRQSAGALANPTLQLVPAFSGSREARDEEIIVAQPLDVFGVRRARSKVGDAEVRRAEAENRLAARTLEVEVKNAASLLFAAQEAENLERIQVEVAQLFRDATAKRAALGDVPTVQVQRADLELFRLQNDLANARAQRITRRTTLNVLIGAQLNASLRVALPLTPSAVALLSERNEISADTPAENTTSPLEQINPDLMVRPDIAGAQATLEARQSQVQALKRERLPQFELQARHAPFIGRSDSSTAIRAVITLPLFDFGDLKGRRRAAQAEAKAQEATVKLLNQRAAAQVEIARAGLQRRRENVARYQNQLLPLTLDLLRKTQIGYAQGASTYLEVLEAQRTLRQIQTEYLQALVSVQSAETALDAAINGGSPTFETAYEISDLQGEAR